MLKARIRCAVVTVVSRVDDRKSVIDDRGIEARHGLFRDSDLRPYSAATSIQTMSLLLRRQLVERHCGGGRDRGRDDVGYEHAEDESAEGSLVVFHEGLKEQSQRH